MCFIIGSLTNGGAEQVISCLANYFANKGENVYVITVYQDVIDYSLDSRVKYISIDRAINNRVIKYINRSILLRDTTKYINPDIIISFIADINVLTMLSIIGLKHTKILSERNDPRNDKSVKKSIDYYEDGVIILQMELFFKHQMLESFSLLYWNNVAKLSIIQ